jgi:hypothetical protein
MTVERTSCPRCGGPCERTQPIPFAFHYESLVKGEVVADVNMKAEYECAMDAYLVGLHLEIEDWPTMDVPVRVLVIKEKEDSVIHERTRC